MMRDKKELEKSLRYFRHKAEYTVESDERKEMYVIAAEAAEKVLNPDFVQVVRCGDCLYGDKGAPLLVCVNPKCTKSWYGCRVLPNHYCSYGERREEG